ncbi:hypothetical protein P175DRAFT_0501418 [Aspergillus ochraceoroseus IBT 24754]|uniref:ABM domain-containing protein n=1 Tax=Aspergillus ochraceoroseus IBT 24754 TaxID=1392256 RepID=A0A2T5LWX9_9EURO|nr:uncharacterized protein P175DRAFT_0501418 [Aspergillus ochraceoroseus IBT 24754]PTU20780.1 hypothetical protein P175DRAFT_0501418 [Aspergillus ochraceoroseus IBT 24754]
MAVAVIIQLDANLFPRTEAPRAALDEKVQGAVRALQEVTPRPDFILGSQQQDQTAIQITYELPILPHGVGNEPDLESSPFLQSVRSLCGEPRNVFHVALDRPVFGPDGPALANVVEFVLSYFPVSRITPDFQTRVQDDFLRFDEIFSPAAIGSRGWASGWLLEDQSHESLNGEMAKCFFIMRGWDSMDRFQRSLQSDAYQKAIPLLLAWNAPWTMWHVERRS